MSRRAVAKKRSVSTDPMYRSRLVSMIISRLLQDGKKNVARRILYESMEIIEESNLTGRNETSAAIPKTGIGIPSSGGNRSSLTIQESRSERVGSKLSMTPVSDASDSFKIFQQAIFNVTPVVEVKSRRVGGSNYQVPLEVNPERGTALALRWIIQAARQRPGREMSSKLANELLDASNKTGNAIKKREETHRMAEANKAFANYRF
jgi:small subunit ribosomal protein S7